METTWRFVPLILIFGIVIFCWVFLFPYLNRKSLKGIQKKSGKKPGTGEKIAGRMILSHKIERAITLSVLVLLAIFGILYLIKIMSR